MADRALTAGLEAALTNLRPIIFYEGDFANGTLRLCSQPHTVPWNSQSWTGAGALLSISKITETTEIRAAGFSVSLICSAAIVAQALAQCRMGMSGIVWIGGLTDAGAIIADPYLSFEGRLDVPDIVSDGQSGRVTINYESRLRDLERPRELRITHEAQQAEYFGDMGREYIAELQDKVIAF